MNKTELLSKLAALLAATDHLPEDAIILNAAANNTSGVEIQIYNAIPPAGAIRKRINLQSVIYTWPLAGGVSACTCKEEPIND